jgi:hypothetical protein
MCGCKSSIKHNRAIRQPVGKSSYASNKLRKEYTKTVPKTFPKIKTIEKYNNVQL